MMEAPAQSGDPGAAAPPGSDAAGDPGRADAGAGVEDLVAGGGQDAAEREMQLASDAQRSFDDGEFSSAVSLLSSLRSARPDDALVAANLVAAKFKLASSSGRGHSTPLAAAEAMSEVSSQLEDALRPAMTSADFEPSDCVAALFNLALARFFSGDVMGALHLVQKVEDSLDKSGMKPSDSLDQRLRDLRVASSSVAQIDITPTLSKSASSPQLEDLLLSEGGGKKDSPTKTSVSPFLLLAHFRRLLAARQVKAFKKDAKLAASLSGADAVTFDFMRANMEYLRGNHRKVAKSLQNLKVDEINQPWLKALLPALTSNALGCAHLAMGKPEVALFHFREAIRSHHAALQEPAVRQRNDVLHQVKRNQMAYNAAVCLLHRGHNTAAYSTLKALTASPTMASSPQLWLRMAECCIAESIRPEDDFALMTSKDSFATAKNSSSPATVRQLGERENRKLILQQPQSPLKHQPASRFGNGDGNNGNNNTTNGGHDGDPSLTLANAMSCLRKAAYLLARHHNTSSSSSSSAGRPCPPDLRATSRPWLLRAHILLKQSYVSLLSESHSESLRFAREVLGLEQRFPAAAALPSAVVSLARIYAGQSLVFLDRISEATEYLDPTLVPQDISFKITNGSEESGASSAGSGNSDSATSIACKAIINYNLAVAFLTRGELDKAGDMLEALWKARSSHPIQDKVLSARLYVQLKKGDIKKCKGTIRDSYALKR